MGGSLARTGLPTPVPNATYDAANRQLTFGDKTMSYDANGNLTSITDPTGTTTYTWDARNRLASLAGPGMAGSFTYDALGRRVAKTLNGATTQHLYDGADIVQEVAGGQTIPYLRGLNVDEPWVRNSSEFYLSDALGSVWGLTDAPGTLATRYVYDPFGRTSVEGTPSANPFQYTGRENDGTGFYYYRARYYLPSLERFLSEDPILTTRCLQQTYPDLSPRFSPRPQTYKPLNAYAYVDNNPIGFRDPSGLCKDSRCVNRCISKCGAIGTICGWTIVYLGACELACTAIGAATGPLGFLACTAVCVTVEVWECLSSVRNCGIECVNKECGCAL